ncbi:hypothetical protein HDV06_005259 [Boothiomyces sp. JEL0866]|nr:hypothetical protein HDV06_005259 [Boothiomyces sp. JEL0866]
MSESMDPSIPLSSTQMTGNLLSILIAFSAAVLNLGVLWVISKSSTLTKYDNFFTLGQIIFDLLTALLAIFEFSYSTVNLYFLYDYNTCQTLGWLINFLSICSLFCVFSISISPYRILVKKTQALSKRQTITALIMIVLFSAFISSLGYFINEPYVVRRNRGYCCLNLESETIGFVIVLAATLSCYTVPTLVTLYLYLQLWKCIKVEKEDDLDKDTVTSDRSRTLQLYIAKRGLLVFVIYLICYAYPVGFHIVKTAIHGRAPVMFDNFNIWLILMNGVANPIAYMNSEPRFKKVLKQYFLASILGDSVNMNSRKQKSLTDYQPHPSTDPQMVQMKPDPQQNTATVRL